MKSLEREPVSRADMAWLHAEAPTNHFVVTSLAILKTAPDVDRLKTVLRHRISLSPRLRQVISDPTVPFARATWLAARDFDLDAHVHRVALPAPAGKAELAAFIGDLVGQALDFGRPLWSVYAVETSHGGGAAVARFHHSLGDGQAMVHLLLSLTDRTEDGWRRRARRRPMDIARRRDGRTALAHLVDSLPSAPQMARTAVQGAGTLARLTLLDPDRPTSLHGRLGLVKAVSWTEPIPLGDIKAIARASGTTVNDVLVSSIAGGLGSYLRQTGTDTRGQRLRAIAPVNLRPEGDHSMQGNRLGLVFLEMPVGVEDAWERLMRVRIEMDRIKSSLEPVVGWLMVQGLGFLPSSLEHLASNYYSAKASLVLTNVTGPERALFLAGNRIEQMTYWEPEPGGLGLGMSIYSYDGQVTVGVVSDRHLVGRPESLTTEVVRAFTELAREASLAVPGRTGRWTLSPSRLRP